MVCGYESRSKSHSSIESIATNVTLALSKFHKKYAHVSDPFKSEGLDSLLDQRLYGTVEPHQHLLLAKYR